MHWVLTGLTWYVVHRADSLLIHGSSEPRSLGSNDVILYKEQQCDGGGRKANKVYVRTSIFLLYYTNLNLTFSTFLLQYLYLLNLSREMKKKSHTFIVYISFSAVEASKRPLSCSFRLCSSSCLCVVMRTEMQMD